VAAPVTFRLASCFSKYFERVLLGTPLFTSLFSSPQRFKRAFSRGKATSLW
jgi:hypothetical protein